MTKTGARILRKNGGILNLGALNLAMGIGVRLETFEVPDRLEEMPGDAFNPPFFCRK